MIRLFFLYIFAAISLYAENGTERNIVIVIPSYNNVKWCAKNISTAMSQKYENFRIIYINDCSSDGTARAVEAEANSLFPGRSRIVTFDNASSDIEDLTARFNEEVNRQKAFFTLVNNTCRSGGLQNLYLAIYSCDDNEIVATLDGDDWFPHDQVLKKLNDVYGSGEIWLTHGKMIEHPSGSTHWCIPIPPELVNSGKIRGYRCPSHLRTFYAGLFKKIQLQDLLYQGKFFSVTWDMAMMYPMVEMAAERHAFINEVNYVYNRTNPINDDKVHTQLQRDLDRYVRSKPPYQRLAEKPF